MMWALDRSSALRGRGTGLTLAAGLLVAAIGCGQKDGPRRLRVPVQGVVTVDGQPLEVGDIIFSNRDAGEVDACRITNGQFRGMVCPGTRRVEIISVPRRANDAPASMEPAENRLPARYSMNSTLTADVREKGRNDFTFELQGK